MTLLSALTISHGLKCEHSCTGSDAACSGESSLGSHTCDASDAVCIDLTTYDAESKAEFTRQRHVVRRELARRWMA